MGGRINIIGNTFDSVISGEDEYIVEVGTFFHFFDCLLIRFDVSLFQQSYFGQQMQTISICFAVSCQVFEQLVKVDDGLSNHL